MPERTFALTRGVSSAIARCELTHLERTPIDVAVARAQHSAYERALEAHGCTVLRLGEDADLPDSVFIEDTAVVFDELAVISRPGAASRRSETIAVEEKLAVHRPVRRIESPATLDGGDVVCAGRTAFVGTSTRTNAAAADQLQRLLSDFGYVVRAVPVQGCLHLKSALTAADDDVLLVNRPWIPDAGLTGFELVHVDAEEPFAANALRLGDRLIYAAAFPRTRERLEKKGYRVSTVELSELAKAEGAVTCCSLIIPPSRSA
ncbi:MAG: dimethylarginine dimethylaminohydrolase family protein [Gemmatimonadaceae bacterium]